MRQEPQRKHSFQVVPPADGWNDLPETALWIANNNDNGGGTSEVGKAKRITSRHRYQVTSSCSSLPLADAAASACRGQTRPPLSRPPSSFTKPSLSQTPGSVSQTSLSSLDSDGFVMVPKDSSESSLPLPDATCESGVSPSSDSLCMGLSQVLTIPSNLPPNQLTHCASKLEKILSSEDLSSHHREAVAMVFNSLLATSNHQDNPNLSDSERQAQAKKIVMQHMLSNPDSASWATALRRLVEGIKA